MVGAVAGAAAVYGFAAAWAEIRRRLMIRARIARRLTWIAESRDGHNFRLHSMALLPILAEDADPA